MICLGWCSEAGALAQSYNIAWNAKIVTELQQSTYLSRGAGYGLSCFAYLCASLSAIGMALYISPDIASEFEKRILASQFYVDPLPEAERKREDP
jgi:hypothetical protein